MINMRAKLVRLVGTGLSGVSLLALAVPVALAQESGPAEPAAAPQESSSGTNDIIVTAQKRSQSINDVPLSITAASGDQLRTAGITSTADLAKIVPGLTAQPSPLNTPVYTLRGVGYFEFSLAASPTVAVYTDEVALPFSAMTKAAALDVERVEVLKGPQGTLFGQNTTGGAINYVAAKPTDTFEAGTDISFGRFNTLDTQAFLSGPLTDNLRARLAVRTIQGDDWQKNYTRDDSIGARNEMQGRLLLDWTPTSNLTITVNLNGWIDKSDSQAPQLIGAKPNVPANTALADAINNYPLAPRNARAADWRPGTKLAHDDYFMQGALRGDLELGDITLTSITAYERYKTRSAQDFDGSSLVAADVFSSGHINTFSQELRLSGKTDRLIWIVGGNYESDRTLDNNTYLNEDSSTSVVAGLKGTGVDNFSRQNIETKAIFGNLEYEIADGLTAQVGARYTKSDRSFAGCGKETDPARGFGDIFEFLQTVITPTLPVIPIGPGQCYTFDSNFRPIITPFEAELNEDNISWRGSLSYKTGNNGLLYATVSKGYKAGSFPTVPAGSTDELLPVTQESLVAYELGFKQSLFDRALQLTGAAFYYDYRNKQIRGRKINPVFGPLEALVQIPKSRVYGAELTASARPVDGLDLSISATYLDTKIQRFEGFNTIGVLSDFSGFSFPFSPKWSVVGDAGYSFPLNDRLDGAIGASFTHNSATTASIGNVPQLAIDDYTLVDARVGVRTSDGKWSFDLWGRNIFNEYYWTSANAGTDTYIRFTGRPATYGATLSFRY